MAQSGSHYYLVGPGTKNDANHVSRTNVVVIVMKHTNWLLSSTKFGFMYGTRVGPLLWGVCKNSHGQAAARTSRGEGILANTYVVTCTSTDSRTTNYPTRFAKNTSHSIFLHRRYVCTRTRLNGNRGAVAGLFNKREALLVSLFVN